MPATKEQYRLAMADWLNREDMTDDQLNSFIDRAAEKLAQDPRWNNQIQIDMQHSFTKEAFDQYNNVYITGLAGYISRLTDVYLDGERVEYVPSIEMVRRERKDPQYKAGVYTLVGDFFGKSLYYSGYPDEFDDIDPDNPDQVWTIYGKTFDVFPNSQGSVTDWSSRDTSAVVLTAALVEAATFLRDWEGLQFYKAAMEEELNNMYKTSKLLKVSDGPMAVRSIGPDYFYDRSW